MFKLSRSLISIFKAIAIGVPTGITIVDVVGYVARVEGYSMQPVFNPDGSEICDYVFLHNWPIATNAYSSIRRGDIIAVISPRDPKLRIIKRVIALGGDVVETHGYYKPYVTVPPGHCWIEGDHRGQSLDSNIFGPVALGLVKSKAKCIVWPPSRWQILNVEMLKDRVPINLVPNKKLIEHCDLDMKLKFSGSVLKNAICFGDCDNDGFSELILGTTGGDLFVYRNDRCLCCASDLGTVSAVAVGDLLNISRNVLVAVTVEGWCHIFDVQYEFNSSEKVLDVDFPQNSSSEYHHILSPFHSQRIVCNTKVAILGDVNGDGLFELIVGLTDRVLRTYQWKLEVFVDEATGKEDRDEECKSEIEVYDGRLYPMNKWEFASQIGSVSLHSNQNLVSILVGQPGGSVTKITESPLSRPVNEKAGSGVSEFNLSSLLESTSGSNSQSISQDGSAKTAVQDYSILRNASPADHILIEHYELDKSSMRNQNISTEVAGNVSSSPGGNNDRDSYAIATTDGTVLIAKGNNIERTFQCDHQILALHQLNGKVIFVGWEGDTYILDTKTDSSVDKSITRFHFDESVAGFVVGSYAMSREDKDDKSKLMNTYSMAFVTFHGKVYVYVNEFLE